MVKPPALITPANPLATLPLPASALATGQIFTSDPMTIPAGAISVVAELNGAAWGAAVTAEVALELATDGATYERRCAITATHASLEAGSCAVGELFSAPNANAVFSGRVKITPSGAGIVLAGTLKAY